MGFLATYAGTYRSASAAIKLYLLSTVVYWLGSTIVQLYLNFYMQAQGLDQAWIGLVNAAPSITIVIMTLFIGYVSSRMGPWRASIMGTLIATAGVALVALADGPWPILLANIVGGIGSGFLWANSGPFMMAHTRKDTRATFFSLQAAASTLTGFIAYQVGGQLPLMFSTLLGQPQEGVSVMRSVLILSAAFYGLSLLPIYLAGRSGKTIEEQESPDEGRAEEITVPAGKRVLVSDVPLYARLLLPGTVVSVGAGMTMPFLNIYIEHKFSVSFEGLGQIFAWNAVATAAALLIQPILADKFGKVKSVVLVQGASLPFLLILGYGQFFPLVVVSMFVRGALMNMGNPVFSAYSMERVPARERATFSSMSSSTWSLGWAIGSWLSGTLRDALGFAAGFDLLFGAMSVFYAASMVLMWVWFVPDETRQRKAAVLEKAQPAVVRA